MKPSINPLDLVFSPTEIGTIGRNYLEYRRTEQGKGIPLYIPALDYNPITGKGFLPVLSGEIIALIGRPGNGKTGFMMRWARTRARILQRAIATGGAAEERIVVYTTLEQSVEELHAFHVAAETGVSITTMAYGTFSDEQWQKVQAVSAKRSVMPLWFIGHSIARRAKRPTLTIDTLSAALDGIEKWDGGDCTRKIDMLFIDYLQRFPTPERAESKTVAMSDTYDRLKNAALALGCAVIVGVQAKREVDDRRVPIPGMEDGQWTSNIEQTSDGVLSVVRPRHYRHEGHEFDGVIVEGSAQMIVSCLKRKLGPANFKEWIDFDVRYNSLNKAEVKYSESEDENA